MPDSLLLTKAGQRLNYLKASFLDLAFGLHMRSMSSNKVMVAAAF
jgi:hypothetical protein